MGFRSFVRAVLLAVVFLGAPTTTLADLVVTLFEAPDGTTDVEILGSGQTTDSGSATFSVALDRQFLGNDDSSDHFGTAMSLSGVVGGIAVPFLPGLRLLDGAAVDQFQFSLGGGYAASDSYSFSGVGNFATLDFSSLTSSGVFTAPGSGDAMDFAEFSLVIEVPEPTSGLLGPSAIALVAAMSTRRRSRSALSRRPWVRELWRSPRRGPPPAVRGGSRRRAGPPRAR